MGKRIFYNRYFGLLLGLLLLGFSLHISSSLVPPKLQISQQESALNLNRQLLKLGSLGNNRLISSILWIQTMLDTDHEHYSKDDLSNWMYLRFLSISELDPKFYENYLWGGMLLAIVKDDIRGASHLFELGLSHFPEDYRLNYMAGYNYYFELGNYEKGLERFLKIEGNPLSPPGLKFIINKLRFEVTKDANTTLEFLRYTLANTNNETIRIKLAADIYAVKAQRDLECLNAGGESCELRDEDGRPYLKSKGTWKTYKEFKPYKIFRK